MQYFSDPIGNDVIVTTLLSEATSLKDRTKAMAYLALSQSFGFTLGPGENIILVKVVFVLVIGNSSNNSRLLCTAAILVVLTRKIKT